MFQIVAYVALIPYSIAAMPTLGNFLLREGGCGDKVAAQTRFREDY